MKNNKIILLIKGCGFIMKYQEKSFTPELKAKIQDMESALKEHSKILLQENRFIFEEKNLEFHASLDVDGHNHFQPGYWSSIVIGVSEKAVPDSDLINMQLITIWKCVRTVLGLEVSTNIPGSKIIGMFVDETLEELKEELREYIEEFLSEEY
ncbi:hypothetical protein HNQ44_003055 [Planomicrobium koreense]|uniref:Uncharacterized protein n=1 Tax=Planococcus koreensis TaxID=112331 RepID=A0A7W8CU40_9BACL|nr:hypothetical protein [Planococcus koreensis]MBB5181590.1 hypothetical protein [Planococcus koreensis]